MGVSSAKKKLSSANRRLRERSKLSFLFVIFFFGLFSLIIVMESLMADGGKNIFKDEDGLGGGDGDNEDYTNWDISYEEVPPGSTSAISINSPLIHPRFIPPKQTTQKQNKPLHPSLSLSASSSHLAPLDAPKVNSNNNANLSPALKSNASAPAAVSLSPAQEQTTLPNNSKFTPIQSDWQNVMGSKEKFHVYSAYYNPIFEQIRIIGATRTKSQQHVFCRFYDSTAKVYVTVNATIRTIRENWNLKYSACFIICYIPHNKSQPRYVSVVSTNSPTASASNILRIQYPAEQSDSLVDFSVCVKPVHFNFNSILPFLEWIEFYRLMGVTRFTFYNHTIGPAVSCLMREYGDLDIQVLPWSLPFISQKEIRTEGLFVALNDCVYRHRGSSKYLLLVDLDEMIVPRKSQNYTALLDKLDTLSNRKKIGAYSFQNAFFYLQWPDDQSVFHIEGNPLAERVSKKLLTLRKTRRKSRLHPHKQRSKYICDPEKVVEAGNHFVWEMATGYFTLSVPPHLGTLHHYRVCEFGGDQCTKSPFVIDKSSHNFGQQLAIRVADKLSSMATKCHLNIDKAIDSLQTQHGETSTVPKNSINDVKSKSSNNNKLGPVSQASHL